MNDIEKNMVKFAAILDERILPQMPKGKNISVLAQRQFLGIIAARQAKLQAQTDWLKNQQEYYRRLHGE